MEMSRKLAVLADAAKYDASCASSGARLRSAGDPAEVGVTYATGADGRRMALLKILLTNECIHDCHFCIHRRSSDVERASFTPEEVVALTLDYHRRGVIDGLFLSSGVAGSADATMEQLVRVARTLRREHHYRGYIHLKTIPGASDELIEEGGRWADRLSVNIELPRERDLARLAPDKSLVQIRRAMHTIGEKIEESRARRATAARWRFAARSRPNVFAPAGQTTQMIVGATDATDADILLTAAELYAREGLRRIYYSAYIPIARAPGDVPTVAPPLLRELRLYQADWLIRGYGYTAGDLTPPGAEHLDLSVDPKLAWALRHRDRFPVDINRASRAELLRVPGLGATSAARIIAYRRHGRLSLADLVRMHIPLARTLPFIVARDHVPRVLPPDARDLRERLTSATQLELFVPTPPLRAATGF